MASFRREYSKGAAGLVDVQESGKVPELVLPKFERQERRIARKMGQSAREGAGARIVCRKHNKVEASVVKPVRWAVMIDIVEESVIIMDMKGFGAFRTNETD